MSTWTASNTTFTKKVTQRTGAGVPLGELLIEIPFSTEVLKDGMFHHNYSGSIGAPSDGDFQAAVTRAIQEHLRLWKNTDSVDDNAAVQIKNVISLEVTNTALNAATAAFNAAYFNLQQLNGLVTAGILASDDPSIVTALSLAKTAYQAKVKLSN
jgi:hypothetical protein